MISCVIPASPKDKDSQMLKDLIQSIRDQDYPQDQVEILVITEGDSESAKAEGIRRSKGDIIGMFCADNMIMNNRLFSSVDDLFKRQSWVSACYSRTYHHKKNDNSLNRYFSLIGGNDPICWYLGKNDRWPQVFSLRRTSDYQPSYGCNGFFYRAELIKNTDLDHYYPMDNAMEVPGEFLPFHSGAIWHRTSDNLITFLKKRYKYARDLYCERMDRRWRIIDTPSDIRNLILFCISTILVIPCLSVSFTLFKHTRDKAAFWHWPVCFGFLITYGALVCRNLLVHRSSCLRSGEGKVLKSV